MKILAIDTSTAVMGVALMDETKVYAEVVTNLKKNHSVRLMPTIEQCFSEVNWLPEEIELIAVTKGPGSYTGVRIGVTTAKALGLALNIPIVGVSTLEVMAYQNKYANNIISPILDARRGQVYTGLYNSNNGWLNEKEDRIIQLTEWLEILQQDQQKVLFVGDDLKIHQEQIKKQLGDQAIFSEPTANFPRPSILALRALELYSNGIVDNVFDFAPAYLQLAEAEVKWLEKQNIENG